MLRKMSGPIKDQNGRRSRTNDDLHVLYRNPHIATTITVRRLEWAGRLVRSDGRAVKKVLLGKPDGNGKV
jgi:hypothetical protein